MSGGFCKQLHNLTITGVVTKVIENDHNPINLFTRHNSIELCVKLDNPIELQGTFEYITLSIDGDAKSRTFIGTPKEGSRITAKGTLNSVYLTGGRGKWRKTYRMRKNPHLEAFQLYNNAPKAFINHKELSPIHKMGLKLSNNDVASQDVYAVVYQNFKSNTKVLVDVVVGKNRDAACNAFFNKPEHKYQLDQIRNRVEPVRDPHFSHSEDHTNFFHTIKLYRLNYKNPTVEWNEFGSYFERTWENVMMANPIN